jgi:hypothetical protein
MEKQLIKKAIYIASKSISKYCETNNFTWGEVKKKLTEKNIVLQDDDILEIYYDEGFQEEDNAKDNSYMITVTILTLETDEQFDKRKKKVEELRLEKLKRDEEKDLADWERLKLKYGNKKY